MSNVSQILFRSDHYLVKTVNMLISKLLLYECHNISDMWAWESVHWESVHYLSTWYKAAINSMCHVAQDEKVDCI